MFSSIWKASPSIPSSVISVFPVCRNCMCKGIRILDQAPSTKPEDSEGYWMAEMDHDAGIIDSC